MFNCTLTAVKELICHHRLHFTQEGMKGLRMEVTCFSLKCRCRDATVGDQAPAEQLGLTIAKPRTLLHPRPLSSNTDMTFCLGSLTRDPPT